eukprot:gene12963-14211_t
MPVRATGQYQQQTYAIQYSGINIAGLDFVGVNYSLCTPRRDTAQLFASQGHNVFRIPFKWEKLQPCLRCDLDVNFLSLLDRAVKNVLSTGSIALIDCHNYFRYNDTLLSSIDPGPYTNLWYRLAQHYTNNDRIWFGLMNEPHDMTTEMVFNFHQQAIWTIRSTGNLNKIVISGNGWDGLTHWADTVAYYGTPNSKLALMDDTANNHVYEMHIYFDTAGSGAYGTCDYIDWNKIQATTDWLRSVGKKAIITEFGLGNNDNCVYNFGEVFLKYLSSNQDVYDGYTYWAAGTCWPNNYVFTVDPNNAVSIANDRRVQLLSNYSAHSRSNEISQSNSAFQTNYCNVSLTVAVLYIVLVLLSFV